MKVVRSATQWSCVAAILRFALPGIAGDANPPPPQVQVAVTNGQQRLVWTPFPAADQFKILSATNVTWPFVEDPSGSIAGYGWTAPLNSPQTFHRLQVTPLSANDLLAATVLNRLTYGPTPDDWDHIRAIGPQAFMDEQMAFEAVSETLNTDSPITNVPLPAVATWMYAQATGTANGGSIPTGGTNIWIYLSGPGAVYLDDVKLVTGTNANVGPNLVGSDGDFEAGLSPLFTFGTNGNMNGSVVSSNVAHSGANSFWVVNTSSGSGINYSITYPYATSISLTQKYTLSFWYLAASTNANVQLTLRLSGSLTITNVNIRVPGPTPPPTPPATIAATYARLTNTVATLDDLRAWLVFRAVRSPRQLHEVLAEFFQNHFTTQWQKTKDWYDNNYAYGAYTNDTIRQHLATDLHWREHNRFRQLLLDPNCTFYDLLKASVESPAMIIYLDTVLNTKSAANENYAREVLELHTMGADNGYLQQDIVDLAKVWTGWRVDKKDASVASDPFAPPISHSDLTNLANLPGLWVLHFATNSHNYTSTKRLFTNNVVDPRFGGFRGGQPYSLILSNNAFPGTNGLNEGYLVAQHLANLPYTMEFISVKLCRVFVHENFQFGVYDYTAPVLSPEAQLIKDCMTAWNTPAADGRKGNIRSVLGVIFNSSLFRGHAASQQKVKTPLEFAVSVIRALRVTTTDANSWVSATADTDGYGVTGQGNTSPLARMGSMALFNKLEPDGYSEFGRIWLNTANLCERMRFVQHLLMPAASSLKTSDYGNPGLNNTSDPVKFLKLKLDSSGWNDAGAVVDFFLDRLMPGEGRANLDLDRTAAITFLNTDETGNASPFSTLTDPTAYDGRVRGMVALLMCFPRFEEQ